MRKLYDELYRFVADLERAECSMEREKLEKEIRFLEGLIWNIEYYED